MLNQAEFGEYTDIWTAGELALKMTSLEMVDPFKDNSIEIIRTHKLVRGYPFEI